MTNPMWYEDEEPAPQGRVNIVHEVYSSLGTCATCGVQNGHNAAIHAEINRKEAYLQQLEAAVGMLEYTDVLSNDTLIHKALPNAEATLCGKVIADSVGDNHAPGLDEVGRADLHCDKCGTLSMGEFVNQAVPHVAASAVPPQYINWAKNLTADEHDNDGNTVGYTGLYSKEYWDDPEDLMYELGHESVDDIEWHDQNHINALQQVWPNASVEHDDNGQLMWYTNSKSQRRATASASDRYKGHWHGDDLCEADDCAPGDGMYDEEPYDRNSKLPDYKHPDHKQFIEDMSEAGHDIHHYNGRNFWSGPSVHVEDVQDAMSYTKVPLQWDNLGRRFVVYPRASDASMSAERINQAYSAKHGSADTEVSERDLLKDPANSEKVEKLRDDNGKLTAYGWPGGYPIVYTDDEGSSYCPDCASQTEADPPITDYFVHYEGPPEQCSGCATKIDSAYGDFDQDDDDVPHHSKRFED